MPIAAIALNSLPMIKPAASAAAAPGAGFADTLTSLVKNVNETAAQANVAVGNMINKTGDVHETMLALQRAETSFQMTVQVRNKLMQAYNDIMRMPV